MKWIGDRVSYKNHENFFTMIITAKTEGWKMWAMIIWQSHGCFVVWW